MQAIITAGGTPTPKEPLYQLTQGMPKALLPLAGKPMVQWILDALSGSERVSNVIIAGLPPFTDLACRHPLTVIADQGGMIENIRAGVDEIRRIEPDADKALVVSSDIPAVQPDMVDWMVKVVEERDADVFYNVVPREVMEAAFPGSKRTYTRLRDVEVCGGDMNAIRLSLIDDNNPFFKQLISSRKNPFKQASLFGFDILFMLLLNQLSLQDAEKKASERLGLKGAALLCPYAEMGMDVDKPHQFEMVQSYLKKRSSK